MNLNVLRLLRQQRRRLMYFRFLFLYSAEFPLLPPFLREKLGQYVDIYVHSKRMRAIYQPRKKT